MKVVNLLLLPIGAAMTLYAGTTVYIHSQARDLFQRAAIAAQPFGELRLGGISSTPGGGLSFRDLALVANDTPVLTVDSIEFETPSILHLAIALHEAQSRDELPTTLKLKLSGVDATLDGPLMARFDQLVNSGSPRLSAAALLCDRGLIAPAQLRNLGYERIKLDLVLGYDYHQDTSLSLDFTVNVPGVGKGTGTLDLDGIGALDMAHLQKQRLPHLAKIDLRYDDDGYTERMVGHCAKFKRMSPDSYIAASAGRSDAAYLDRWGFVPGTGLRWGYRTFLTAPGMFHLRAKPEESFDLSQLARHTPAMIPSLLDMRVEVNGLPIPDLTITAIAADKQHSGAQRRTQRPISQSWHDAAARTEARPRRRHWQAEYQPVPIEDLELQIGHRVRIALENGAVREGWLASVDDERLEIEQRSGRQSVTMAVERDAVAEVEALLSTASADSPP